MSAVLQLQPGIGRRWGGGIFGGIIGGQHLIVGPELSEPADWAAATAWANDLSINGHSDFRLPALAELALLHSSLPRLFRREAYWSCASQPDLPADALIVHFGAGCVVHWAKRCLARAIAVRRPSFEVPRASARQSQPIFERRS